MTDSALASAGPVTDQGPGAAYWNCFYAAAAAPEEPSAFARQIAHSVARPDFVIDLGCGNGRDSAYFASLGWTVCGLDGSAAAVTRSRTRIEALGLSDKASFVQGEVDDHALWGRLAEGPGVPLVYPAFRSTRLVSQARTACWTKRAVW